MVICDSHCHVATTWFAPVESLVHEMDLNGVETALLVQIRGQYDNDYLLDCVRRFPGRFGAVVVVDTDSPDACAALERWAATGAVGVRLRADTRLPGEDPLTIWRTAARLGLAVSCSGTAQAFASGSFARLVQALPTLPIVLEHFAGLEHLGDGGRAREQQAEGALMDDNPHAGVQGQVLTLARFSNVYAKVHGLGEFCVRAMPVSEPFPFVRPIPPLLDQLYQAFGPHRLMWGSDYPPVCMREGYRLALRLVMDEFARRSADERDAIFGRTALGVFPVGA
jgi:L-fuconolactonase